MNICKLTQTRQNKLITYTIVAINIRTHAADILEYWQEGKDYADSLVNRWQREEELSQEDRNLLNALVL